MKKTEAIKILEELKHVFELSVLEAELGNEDAIEAFEDNENCVMALNIAINELNKKLV